MGEQDLSPAAIVQSQDKGQAIGHYHLNVFDSLMNKLLGTGVKIDEEEQTTILLYSMPDSWYNLIMSLSHMPKLDMDPVIASLPSEEMRRRSLELSSPVPSSSTLVLKEGRGTSRSKGPIKRDKGKGKSKIMKDLKCYYCYKSDHMKKDY